MKGCRAIKFHFDLLSAMHIHKFTVFNMLTPENGRENHKCFQFARTKHNHGRNKSIFV